MQYAIMNSAARGVGRRPRTFSRPQLKKNMFFQSGIHRPFQRLGIVHIWTTLLSWSLQFGGKNTCPTRASWEARHAPAYAHKFSDGREQSCAHIPTMSDQINSLANFGHQPTPAHKGKIPGKQFAADLMQSEMEWFEIVLWGVVLCASEAQWNRLLLYQAVCKVGRNWM